MPRGRKPDHTIPATRALTMQRDYRARRSQYVADLEVRCKRAEEENVRLRAELEVARRQAGTGTGTQQSQVGLSPQAIQASAQLRVTLEAAAAAVEHFMQVAMPPSSDSLADTALLDLFSGSSTGPLRAESPCCGGFIDCEGLVEEDGESDERHPSNLSQIRSTSGPSLVPCMPPGDRRP
ncbi:basic region leucin zipper protein [Roridomyces roridus]|uniref:Basic region leucin zipper protein n=1 Tax=Roridomyces roridus TaxID=1738132 RepID=A0AAD7F9Y0_9AGAR|nr:basic region leucin zipper protein [Roridomyces roridus]